VRVLPMLFAALLSIAALAVPTPNDVKAAVGRGDYASAESMLKEVVSAHPNSAKAHYEYAEVLAHNHHYDDATDQMLTAKHLDPNISFTNPEKFRSLEADLLNHGNHQPVRVSGAPVVTHQVPVYSTVPVQHERSGMGPLGFILMIVVIIAVVGWLVSLFGRRNTTVVNSVGGGSLPGGGSYTVGGGGYGMGGPTVINTGGSGIGAGLAGFAAGVVADELVERALDRPHYGSSGYGPQGYVEQVPQQDQYIDPGAQADRDMDTRPIDFGNDNSNSWDSGGSSFDSGSSDSGGSSDGW